MVSTALVARRFLVQRFGTFDWTRAGDICPLRLIPQLKQATYTDFADHWWSGTADSSITGLAADYRISLSPVNSYSGMAKVYVGNLPPGIPEHHVEREFERFGRCKVWVARKPPGFGFVEYEDPRDAEDAVKAMDGFDGWRVEFSRGPRPGGPPPMRRYEEPPPPAYYRRSPPRYSPPPYYARRGPSPDRRRGYSPAYRRRSRSRDRADERDRRYRDRSRDRRRRSPTPDGRDRRRSRSRDRDAVDTAKPAAAEVEAVQQRSPAEDGEAKWGASGPARRRSNNRSPSPAGGPDRRERSTSRSRSGSMSPARSEGQGGARSRSMSPAGEERDRSRSMSPAPEE